MRWVYERLHGPMERYFGAVVRGLERIPAGAALYVGNHNGAVATPDTFLFGFALYRERGLDDVPYGLAHEVALNLPLINQFLVPLGAVRAGYDTAERLFAAGHKVLVYPGGDIDAMRPWRDRNRVVFGPRRGYIRLALKAGVPIVPVVAAGAHEGFMVLTDGRATARRLGAKRIFRVEVWPLALALPWGVTWGPLIPYWPVRTRILVEVLPPIRFRRRGDKAAADADYVEQCHTRVHGAMQAALTRLAAERRSLGRPRGPWLRIPKQNTPIDEL